MTTNKAPDQPTHDPDAVHDRAYKLGWMQAWREWSAVATDADRARMNDRAREMESYDRAD